MAQLLVSKKEGVTISAVCMVVVGVGMVWYSAGFGICLGICLIIGGGYLLERLENE